MIKAFEKIRDDGISLRKLNIFMFVIALASSAALLVAMNLTNANYTKTHEMTKKLVGWRKDAYNLQIGSDYLTEEIRSFVVTGEKIHLANYFEEANVTQRREKALSTLKEKHGDSPALDDLSAAMSESEYLMNKEYYAARLAIEGFGYDVKDFSREIRNVVLSEKDRALSNEEKKTAAVAYLFDAEYSISKTRINNNINNCLINLENEIDKKQSEVALALQKQVLLEHVLIAVQIIVTLAIVILTRALVFTPLRDCVNRIRKDAVIPLIGAYEVRFLAKNYNMMYYTTKENENQLNFDASHDKLTGLFNRRGYEFFFKNIDMDTSALLIIDLDKFKEINDSYGHDTGDEVIKNAAKTIYNSFRTQDYVCRIGGDEFAVIMVRTDPSLEELIKRKINAINERLSKGEDGIPPITCSVGVAFGHENITASEVFKRADEALYKTKENGRSGVTFYK